MATITPAPTMMTAVSTTPVISAAPPITAIRCKPVIPIRPVSITRVAIGRAIANVGARRAIIGIRISDTTLNDENPSQGKESQ
jgi:hypothetical protein